MKLLIFTMIFMVSCSVLEQNSVFYVLSIERSGTDGNRDEFCSDFNLDTEKAQKFFEKAQIISAKEFHDNYSFLPCFVKGKCRQGNIVCDWEIRAGGTGEIICGEKVYLYGCSDCRDLLR